MRLLVLVTLFGCGGLPSIPSGPTSSGPYHGTVTVTYHSAADSAGTLSSSIEDGSITLANPKDVAVASGSWEKHQYGPCLATGPGEKQPVRANSFNDAYGTLTENGLIQSGVFGSTGWGASASFPSFHTTSFGADCFSDGGREENTRELVGEVKLASGTGAPPHTLKGQMVVLQDPTMMEVVEWNLVRDTGDKVIIDEPAAWAGWIPQGAKDEATPGNGLTVHARLVGRDGGAPVEQAESFRFELVNVSRQLGVAMNVPAANVGTLDYDLQFDSAGNAGLFITNGIIAETSSGSFTEAKAHVAAYDWGGWGELRVFAVLADGTELPGLVNDDAARPTLILPKHTPTSHIADAWKSSKTSGLTDDDDSDANPPGDTTVKGDGLTLYEEYRGFSIFGTVTRLDPTVKDLFVNHGQLVDDPSDGLAEFANASSIAVHDVADAEIAGDKTINFNSGLHHLVAQHGVVFTISADSSGDATLGTPGTCTMTEVPTMASLLAESSASRAKANFDATIAHELGHCVHIDHHGSSVAEDYYTWTQLPTGGFHEAGPGNNDIDVQMSDGSSFPPATVKFPRERVWEAWPHGEHSGWPGCLMRYDNADAYIPKDLTLPTNVRVWLAQSEDIGTQLCDGGNATGQYDHPLHGTPQKGSCKQQIRVSDQSR